MDAWINNMYMYTTYYMYMYMYMYYQIRSTLAPLAMCMLLDLQYTYINIRGSRSLRNLVHVAISQRYLLISADLKSRL